MQRGRVLYRDMPWRQDVRPYYILVSEIMLQQTQVVRVVPKFAAFIARFPDIKTLAEAPLADVLGLWSGLGYNRRARYLHEAAKMIHTKHKGTFPNTEKALLTLPGVGTNTAGALLAYAYNIPAIFIETNIRTVYIHHCFSDQTDIHDVAILQKLENTIDRKKPREFYWALMDYGSWLKANGVSYNTKSRHYKKQSKLEGSVRQVRGQIIRTLTNGPLSADELRHRYTDDERYLPALEGLLRDGLIESAGSDIRLTK